jgi:hypothetical protein
MQFSPSASMRSHAYTILALAIGQPLRTVTDSLDLFWRSTGLPLEQNYVNDCHVEYKFNSVEMDNVVSVSPGY